MKLIISAIFILGFSLLCSAQVETEAIVDSLIAEGDSIYHTFDNRSAQNAYLLALSYDSTDAGIYWRLSRAQVDIGEHLLKEEQESYFTKALDYADKAIALDPNNPQAHLRRAIALGKLALHKGVFKSISLVKQVKESLCRCLELSPLEPTAHYVLGRTHHKLCDKPKIARSILGLGWADLDIAEEEYGKAIALDPTFIMYRYDYALLLMEQKRYEEAKEQLATINRLPVRDEDDDLKKEEAAKLLQDKKFQ